MWIPPTFIVEEGIDNDIPDNTNRRFCASISRVVYHSMMGSDYDLVLFLFVDDVYSICPTWTKIYVTTLSENSAVMMFHTYYNFLDTAKTQSG